MEAAAEVQVAMEEVVVGGRFVLRGGRQRRRVGGRRELVHPVALLEGQRELKSSLQSCGQKSPVTQSAAASQPGQHNGSLMAISLAAHRSRCRSEELGGYSEGGEG